jgi:hypothetical protein
MHSDRLLELFKKKKCIFILCNRLLITAHATEIPSPCSIYNEQTLKLNPMLPFLKAVAIEK